MALGSHLITVRRLKKYIDDVIGKKANLPDTSKTIIGNISQINSDLAGKQNYEYTGVYVTGGLNISVTIPSSANEVILLCAHEGSPWTGTSIVLPNYEIQNATGLNYIAGGFQNGTYGLASTFYIARGVVQLTQYFESSQLITSNLHLTAYCR